MDHHGFILRHNGLLSTSPGEHACFEGLAYCDVQMKISSPETRVRRARGRKPRSDEPTVAENPKEIGSLIFYASN